MVCAGHTGYDFASSNASFIGRTRSRTRRNSRPPSKTKFYDKYAKTFREGIKYYRDGKIWGDKGAEWLDGQLAGRALELSSRAKCVSGKKFNATLR